MKRSASRASGLLCVLLAAGDPALASPPTADPWIAPSGSGTAMAGPPAPSVTEALERALSDGWRRLRIEAECRVEGRMARVEVFENGVAIWNDERQLTLSREEVRSLLLAFREAGFAGLRPSYGGKTDPAPSEKQPPRLTCRVALSLDGARRQVVQLQGGRQSDELRGLADRILDACRGKAVAGIGAADLEDGLAKVASGALAPEVLQVLVSRRPEPRPGTDGARGWVLRVEGRIASLEGESVRGPEPAEVRLDDGDLTSLARLALEGGVAELPINLYAEEYTDLVVKVLDREKRVQARRFAGMTRTTHGEAQGRFDRILEALGDRRQRWLAAAQPSREP